MHIYGYTNTLIIQEGSTPIVINANNSNLSRFVLSKEFSTIPLLILKLKIPHPITFKLA